MQTGRADSASLASLSFLLAEMRDLMGFQAWINEKCLPRSRAAPLEITLQLSHVGWESLTISFP